MQGCVAQRGMLCTGHSAYTCRCSQRASARLRASNTVADTAPTPATHSSKVASVVGLRPRTVHDWNDCTVLPS